MKRIRRIAVAGSMLIAAVGLPMTFATSASADQGQCVNYLLSIGAHVAAGATNACGLPAHDGAAGVTGIQLCIWDLEDLNVSASHALTACELAHSGYSTW